MVTAIYVITGYLAAGFITLFLFNYFTHKIQDNMKDAVTDAQGKMMVSNSNISAFMGPNQSAPVVFSRKGTAILLLVVSEIFWPLVLWSYFRSRRGSDD